ncbi:MAG: hypothetical protein ISP49_17350 [Reyranella sp.]|nr:hypothetical protein [Reyranella sp.]
MTDKSWKERTIDVIARVSAPESAVRAFRNADAEMIAKAIRGLGPESIKASPAAGARIVFNISSAHFPAVLGRPEEPGRYRNRYDIAAKLTIGSSAPAPLKDPTLRELVDSVVASLIRRKTGRRLYYGAVELNGSGVRYFGDICMVLRPAEGDACTLVLERNSYDLARSPIKERIEKSSKRWKSAARGEAKKLKGSWPTDVPDMVACKILDGSPPSERRLTTGSISSGVLADEDYVEVIRVGSFGPSKLEEARVSAADAGAEARIADRISQGPSPSLVEMMWRHRRRACERLASAHGISTRVVLSLGRMRP